MCVKVYICQTSAHRQIIINVALGITIQFQFALLQCRAES